MLRAHGYAQLISIHALREEGDPSPFALCSLCRNFYPRPPRGGRRTTRTSGARCSWEFLSTPSARRATRPNSAPGTFFTVFLSTPSARRATTDPMFPIRSKLISIHALREEGDFFRECVILVVHKFLSTPSARRATKMGSQAREVVAISIHALREEGDTRSPESRRWQHNFYPRPPRGGRPLCSAADAGLYLISIHALREEGDSKNREKTLCFCLIIHLPA